MSDKPSHHKVMQCLDVFTPIYENGTLANPIPDNTLVTVYCDDEQDDNGFLYSVRRYQILMAINEALGDEDFLNEVRVK